MGQRVPGAGTLPFHVQRGQPGTPARVSPERREEEMGHGGGHPCAWPFESEFEEEERWWHLQGLSNRGRDLYASLAFQEGRRGGGPQSPTEWWQPNGLCKGVWVWPAPRSTGDCPHPLQLGKAGTSMPAPCPLSPPPRPICSIITRTSFHSRAGVGWVKTPGGDPFHTLGRAWVWTPEAGQGHPWLWGLVTCGSEL